MVGVVAAAVATAATTAAITAAVSVILATDVQLSECEQIISS